MPNILFVWTQAIFIFIRCSNIQNQPKRGPIIIGSSSMNSIGVAGIPVFHSCGAVMIEGTQDMLFRFFGFFFSHIKQNKTER